MRRELLRALAFVALGAILYGCAVAAAPTWDARRGAIVWRQR